MTMAVSTARLPVAGGLGEVGDDFPLGQLGHVAEELQVVVDHQVAGHQVLLPAVEQRLAVDGLPGDRG